MLVRLSFSPRRQITARHQPSGSKRVFCRVRDRQRGSIAFEEPHLIVGLPFSPEGKFLLLMGRR